MYNGVHLFYHALKFLRVSAGRDGVILLCEVAQTIGALRVVRGSGAHVAIWVCTHRSRRNGEPSSLTAPRFDEG